MASTWEGISRHMFPGPWGMCGVGVARRRPSGSSGVVVRVLAPAVEVARRDGARVIGLGVAVGVGVVAARGHVGWHAFFFDCTLYFVFFLGTDSPPEALVDRVNGSLGPGL